MLAPELFVAYLKPLRRSRLAGLLLLALLATTDLTFAQASPLDDLKVTIPQVDKKPQPSDGRGDEKEVKVFEAPKISIAPGNTIDPTRILEVEEDETLRELIRLGASNLASNQVYEAVRYYWRASRRSPNDQEVLAGLGASFLLAEDAERAATIYTALVEKYPAEEDYQFNLAGCRYKLGEYAGAINILDELRQLHPRDPKILYNLALNQLAGGDRETGIRLMERSFALLPENPFPMLALARTHSRAGDKQNMLICLEKAAKLLGPDELKLYLDDPAFTRWKNDDLFEKLLPGGF